MPAPRELLSQQIHTPGNSYDAKSPRLGQIFGSNPQECAGGMVMDEIDTCIIEIIFLTQSKQCGQWVMEVTVSSITIPPRTPRDFHQKFAPTMGLWHPSFCSGGGDLLGKLPI